MSLSNEEIQYLQDVSSRLGRLLTDSEIFGFSQVNSEHCRHKIFNGTFVIDGEEKGKSFPVDQKLQRKIQIISFLHTRIMLLLLKVLHVSSLHLNPVKGQIFIIKIHSNGIITESGNP